MFNFCYIIMSLGSCPDIQYLTVSSKFDISRVCAVFSLKISLMYYREAMNLKTK